MRILILDDEVQLSPEAEALIADKKASLVKVSGAEPKDGETIFVKVNAQPVVEMALTRGDVVYLKVVRDPDGTLKGYSRLAPEKRDRERREQKIAQKAVNIARKARVDFLSNMYSQILTPMQNILNFSAAGAEKGVDVDKAKQYCTRVNESGRSLLEFLKKFLDLSEDELRSLENPDLLSTKYVQMLERGERAPHERLTKREYQVMMMIASGKPVSVIATELGLSVKTVSTHRTRILDKMKLENNAEITYYALKRNLVS